MALIKIKKGLDLPLVGAPENKIEPGNKVNSVAILGDDYVGMKPTMEVQVGDTVKLGQLLFTDKKMEGVKFTAPGTGKVTAINRGAKRAFKSLVIELAGDAEVTFKSYSDDKLSSLDRATVATQLIDSGMWTALRARPFSKVAQPGTVPHSIFVTAMDTNPFAPPVDQIIKENEKAFQNGLTLLSKLTDGTVYLCKAPGAQIPVNGEKNLSVNEFDGPHPAGLTGTHIHFLDPVNAHKTVWYVGAQDVVAIGLLFTTGKIFVERTVSLAGAAVKQPRLIKTRIGASLDDLVQGELNDGENRVISGSVLSGRQSTEMVEYLGRYHQQISVVPEGRQREFLGWLKLGAELFSVKKILSSSIFPKKKFNLTTSLNGGKRAIVPVGSYEKVMPLDILPTFLLRSLLSGDIEESEQLGCLELDEEDLALCTFVCPSKNNYGEVLRDMLTLIEKEG